MSNYVILTFGVISPLNPRGNYSTNSPINPKTLDTNKNFKVHAIKISLDSGDSASIVRKDILYKRHKIL